MTRPTADRSTSGPTTGAIQAGTWKWRASFQTLPNENTKHNAIALAPIQVTARRVATSPLAVLVEVAGSALMARPPARRCRRGLPPREAVGEKAPVVGQPECGWGQVAAPAARVLVAGDLLLAPVPPRAASLVAARQRAGMLQRLPAANGGAAPLRLSAHGPPPVPARGGHARRHAAGARPVRWRP